MPTHNLPADVLRLIFRLLSTTDLCRAAVVSTLWRDIAYDTTTFISLALSPVRYCFVLQRMYLTGMPVRAYLFMQQF